MISIRPAIAVIAATTSGATVKPSWAAKRAARIIRSGSSENESSGAPGVRSTRSARSTTPPKRVLELAARHPHRHRVDGEVATAQVAVERVAEVDVGLARVGVVGLGAVGRDLDLPRSLAAADGAEGATHVPDGVGPAGQQPLGRVGPGRRGEVEVVLVATDHRVADRAADQRQLLAGVGEAGAELVDDGTDPVELCPDPALDLDDREWRQSDVGHDRPVYVPGWLGPATRVGACPARPRSVLS